MTQGPIAGGADATAQPQQTSIYALFLKLSPAFTAQLSLPGVLAAVADAARAGRAPSVEELLVLGQSEPFARLFVERLGYLVGLRREGILRAAGPFEGFAEGLYLCNADSAEAARRVLLQDPLYRAGYIERDFTVLKWLAAI